MNAIQTSLYFGAAIASSPTGDELGAVHGMHPVGAGSGGGTGLPRDKYWTEDGGRVMTDVLPFFARRLVWAPGRRNRPAN